ncbi:hypothetical protein [Halopelagius fulvigenes]|uniref:Uncharacterized protein n=1 Tax=Halopelagius fulvigenes TaxID=1198324 RepID=A0ABD5U182_9EURY
MVDLSTSAPRPAARGFTLGEREGATLGGERGGTLGPQSEQGYRARLTTADGRRTDITSIIGMDLTLEHTAPSDVSLTVPRINGLGSFKFADLDLFYGDSLIFKGRVEEFPGPGRGEEATLAGRGPALELARGDITVDYSGLRVSEAIRRFWTDHTTFTATVYDPETATTLSDGTFEGTPLEVLQDLHERVGMRFTVQHTAADRLVESYKPGALVRQGTWTSVDDSATGSVTDYANKVIVKGKISSDGTQVSATASDQAEIDALGETIPWRITDPTLTTDADCQARADSALEERLRQDTLSGEIVIIPELVLPGYLFEIPEWGGEQYPIETVSYSESIGQATATLKINPPKDSIDILDGLERDVRRLQKTQ